MKRLTIKGCRDVYMSPMEKKLCEYEDLEEQGLLVRLPCKVGDKVYIVSESRKKIYERNVYSFEIIGDNVSIVTDYGDVICQPDFAEQDAFLTREEAEKRLKELNDERD